MTEKWQNCHIIWVTCWGNSSEFPFLVFRNERFYSYKYTKTTGLTSSHKSPVEPTTFLLWGDRTNHCFLKLLRFGTKGFILNYHQCVVAHMQLLPPVTRRLGCGDFLCYTRRRKQEGTMLGVRKGVRKGCQRLWSAQILSVPEPILCDWCHTSPQQFVPRRCHTYWVSGANDTILHMPYLQYRSWTQEALLFHRATCAFAALKK